MESFSRSTDTKTNTPVTYGGLIFLAITWICYLVVVDPFLHKSESIKETFNSYMYLMFAYFIPSYTLMVPDAEIRYEFGNCTIGIIAVLVSVNLIWTVIEVVKDK
jgi:hypothetical protein